MSKEKVNDKDKEPVNNNEEVKDNDNNDEPVIEQEPSIVDTFLSGDIDKVKEMIHKQVVQVVADEVR